MRGFIFNNGGNIEKKNKDNFFTFHLKSFYGCFNGKKFSLVRSKGRMRMTFYRYMLDTDNAILSTDQQ